MKEKILSILLVDDDSTACKEINNYINQRDDIRLIGITNNSTTAIEYVKNKLPDAVILDLELHHGNGNGLLFLSDLQKLELKKRPYILITTNNSSNITYEAARQLGADFILAKYHENYSAQYVVDFLCIIKKAIFSQIHESTSNLDINESLEQKSKELIHNIQQELNFIGISPKVVGYRYLTDAIFYTIQQPTAHLSRILGEKYQKSDASIERAIQNAINRAWRTSDLNDLLMHYTAKINSQKGVPTMMEFVFFYANKIKNKL